MSLFKIELSVSKFANKEFKDDYLKLVIDSMKERISFIGEILVKSPYFFEEPETYDEQVVSKRWKEDSPLHMKKLAEEIEKLNDPTKEEFETALRKAADELEVGAGKLIHPVRLAVSGIGVGPGVFDLLFILGKEEVVKRIYSAIKKIKIG